MGGGTYDGGQQLSRKPVLELLMIKNIFKIYLKQSNPLSSYNSIYSGIQQNFKNLH